MNKTDKAPSEVWKSYWKSVYVKKARLTTRLTTYQIPVSLFLKKIIRKEDFLFILSAGSGQDIISMNLQKYFKNKLHISILDISEDVLMWNRRLFSKYNLNAEFIKGDIFRMPFGNDSFDLVFNTGVLEHFNKKEQVEMTKEIIRTLKPRGYFVTANPSNMGKIYKLGIKAAKEKGYWVFGKEIPIVSLKFLKEEISGIDFVKEYHKDVLSQLGFLSYVSAFYKIITFPIIFSVRLLYCFQSIPHLLDFLFSRIIGTYLIISVIKKSA